MEEKIMKTRRDENIDTKKGEIVIYKAKSGAVRLDVRLEKETVWLNQAHMARLFDKMIPTINEHLKNIYHEGELDKSSTIRKFRIVQTEGKRRVERLIECYNLDVIISVGYRIKSQRGTQFRIWATRVWKSLLSTIDHRLSTIDYRPSTNWEFEKKNVSGVSQSDASLIKATKF